MKYNNNYQNNRSTTGSANNDNTLQGIDSTSTCQHIELKPSLVRRLLQTKNSTRRLTSEALIASSELLRLFVIEARDRAGLEAECDTEAATSATAAVSIATPSTSTINTANTNKRRHEQLHDYDNDDIDDISSNHKKSKKPIIRADHVTKIGAELLFDFT